MQEVILSQIKPAQFYETIRQIIKEEISSKNNLPIKEDKNWSAKETAEYCKVSLVTIHSWTKKGILKKYKISNRIFYKKSEVLEAIQEIETK